MKLIELSGNSKVDQDRTEIRELSDIDAAIWFLSMLVKQNPHITWGDILTKRFKPARPPGTLGVWDWLSDAGDAIYKTSGNIIDGTGDKLGDMVRLMTDEEVREGIMQYGEKGAQAYAAYQTGGASAILPSMFGGQGNPQQQQYTMAAMGQQVKSAFGNIDPKILMIGGGMMFFMMMIMMMK